MFIAKKKLRTWVLYTLPLMLGFSLIVFGITQIQGEQRTKLAGFMHETKLTLVRFMHEAKLTLFDRPSMTEDEVIACVEKDLPVVYHRETGSDARIIVQDGAAKYFENGRWIVVVYGKLYVEKSSLYIYAPGETPSANLSPSKYWHYEGNYLWTLNFYEKTLITQSRYRFPWETRPSDGFYQLWIDHLIEDLLTPNKKE